MTVFLSERTEHEGNDRYELARAFVDRLKGLGKEELAILKRNSGRTLEGSRGIERFYRTLSEQVLEQDDVHFLVATLYALNRWEFGGDFGRSLSSLAAHVGRYEVEHRFRSLLDSEFHAADGLWLADEGLSLRLRQFVRLAEANGVGIDWVQLLVDLQDWKNERRHVQKKWAQSFYAPSTVSKPVKIRETNTQTLGEVYL